MRVHTHNARVPRSIACFIPLAVCLAGCAGPRYNIEDQVSRDPSINPARRASPAQTSAAAALSRPEDQRIDPPWVSVVEWTRTNNLRPPRRLSSGEQPAYDIESHLGTFVFKVGTTEARYDGMRLFLGFEPQVIGGQPCLHHLDLQHNVQPLVLDEPSWLNRQRIVVVDPGHGGRHSGTRSAAGGLEKDFTMDWALRLRPLLEKAGWTVLLTRTNDVEVSLSDRVAFATAANADVFLSLHFNASGGGTHQSGLETYCLTPTGMPSNLTRGYDDDAEAVLPSNDFDLENVQLAARVHHALLATNGSNDRGIRRARFMTVLQRQMCPAILIEAGFLSNPGEAAQITDPAYRQQLAVAVADALRIDAD